jgi:hypothetical protein
MAYDFNKVRYSNSSSFNKKLNKKNTLKMGWVADYTNFNFIDSKLLMHLFKHIELTIPIKWKLLSNSTLYKLET